MIRGAGATLDSAEGRYRSSVCAGSSWLPKCRSAQLGCGTVLSGRESGTAAVPRAAHGSAATVLTRDPAGGPAGATQAPPVMAPNASTTNSALTSVKVIDKAVAHALDRP